MDSITKKLKQYYSRKFSEYGASPKGVDWNREKDVLIRYNKMTQRITETLDGG